MRRLWVYLSVVFGCLVTASAAFAQDPTEQGYGGVGGQVQGGVSGGGSGGASGSASGALPFTGLDLILLVAAGLLLLAAGLTLRRLGRTRA